MMKNYDLLYDNESSFNLNERFNYQKIYRSSNVIEFLTPSLNQWWPSLEN